MSKKLGQIIVETLREARGKNRYDIVGDTLNSFATALSKCGIEFVYMRHEEAGANVRPRSPIRGIHPFGLFAAVTSGVTP